MTCERCHGLLMPTRLSDPKEPDHGRWSIPAVKCANCGDILDWKIRRHRQLSRAWKALEVLA
jgi:RNase P subunit RPR2